MPDDNTVFWFAPWWGRKSRTLIGLRRSKKPGACKSCGTSTLWRTQGDPWKVVHPSCAGLTPLDPGERQRAREVELDALVLLSRELGCVVLAPKPADSTTKPIEIKTGPCGWCGEPGIYITADSYAHCRAHMWPPYRWPERKSA